MIAGQLEIQLMADLARLKKDMADAERIVGNAMSHIERAAGFASKALGLLGASLTVGAFVNYIKGAIDLGDELNKLSQRTGVSVEALSQLQYAAKLADVSHESLTSVIKKLNVSIAEGIAGDKQKVALFQQLGITTKDLGKGTESVMMQMADAYAHAKDGAGKVAVSIGLVGKAGDEAIPFLNLGSAAIRNLMKEADRLGLTIRGDFAEAMEEFNDNLTRIHAQGGALAILIAGDLIESLGKAAQAFATATVEGGKFSGMIAGLQTLLTGDDRHKNNVQLVDLTDALFKAQDRLDRLKANRASTETMSIVQAEIRGLQERIRTTQAYAQVLTAEEKAAKDAAAAIKKAREEGKNLTVPNTAAQAEYDRLIKSIEERIAAGNLELRQGRELTDYEKFETKVLNDLTQAKSTLNAVQQAAVKVKLAEAKAVSDALAIRKAELANAGAEARQWMKDQDDTAAADRARTDERDRINRSLRDQSDALSDAGEQMQLEYRLIGAIDSKRELALGSLKIEQDRKRDILKLNENLLLTEQARNDAIASVNANASVQQAQLAARVALQDQLKLIQDIDDVGRDVWRAMWEHGDDTWRRLGKSLKANVIDALYQLFARRWILNVAANMGVPGAAAAAANAGNLGGGLGAISNALSLGGGSLGAFGSAATGTFQGVYLGSGELSSLGFGEALSGGFEAIAGGEILSGLGAIVGVLGPIAIAAGLIYSFMKEGGGPKAEGSYGYINSGIGSGGHTGAIDDAARTAAQGVQAQFDALVRTLGGNANGLRFGVGVSTDPKGDAPSFVDVTGSRDGSTVFTALNRDVGRSEQELQTALGEMVADAMLVGLQQSDLKGKVGEYFAALDAGAMTAEDIQKAIAAATSAQQLYAAFKVLGGQMVTMADQSVTAVSALAEANGGFQTLAANLGSFYQNFFTVSERRVNTARDIQETLAGAGLNLSVDQILAASRQQFKDFLLTLAPGSDLWNALVGVNGAFASITPEMEDATSALDDFKRKAQDLAHTLFDEAQRTRDQLVPQDVQGLDYLLAQFAINTGQARALDLSAADRLVGLNQSILSLAQQTLSPLDFGSLAAAQAFSLDQTGLFLDGASSDPATAIVTQLQTANAKLASMEEAMKSMQVDMAEIANFGVGVYTRDDQSVEIS